MEILESCCSSDYVGIPTAGSNSREGMPQQQDDELASKSEGKQAHRKLPFFCVLSRGLASEGMVQT